MQTCMLQRDEAGLYLTDGELCVRGDFSKLLKRVRPQNLHGELLVKAARIKSTAGQMTAVDATAGLGDDSFLLAAAGFEVWLYEQNETIAQLLDDTIARALADNDLAPIAMRMHVMQGDSVRELPHLSFVPDVVLLDPMFPAKNKSAQVKKKLQLLQQLERPCEDERALLDAALAARPRKILVKRPIKGPYLAGQKPDYSIAGKAIRYDVIVR